MRIPLLKSRAWTILLLWVSLSLITADGPAQVRIPPDATVDVVADVIQQGQMLEEERRWGDALTYYEGALRDHPGRLELQHRVSAARTHLDVARRYSDRSFLASLDRLSAQQTLDLFSEVLLKIETYHVNDPDWNAIVARGVDGLGIATTEPAFVDRFARPASADPAGTFWSQIRASIGAVPIRSRQEACDAVARAAQLTAGTLGIPAQATILEFTCAAASSLDHYSAFLTGDQLDEVFSQIEGNFVGLGIELKADNQSLLIVNVIPGGPAADAGLRADDRIIEVDRKSTVEVSTDVAADMLKGPEYSYVEILIQHPDQTAHRHRVQRRRVDVPSIQDAQILNPTYGIAYMKLTSFQKTTSQDMDNALWALHRKGMRFLIVDVRKNPGGLLNASVEVADKFLSAGTIVSTRGRSIREDFDYRAHDVGTWRVPLFVLIDADSASASEIFAGAIRDHQRGTVIGERSYGKGSVQGIFPLSRYKSGIRLTTAKFYSPTGRAISHQGVIPDIRVDPTPRHVTARVADTGQIPKSAFDDDPVVQAAVHVAISNATNYQVSRTTQ